MRGGVDAAGQSAGHGESGIGHLEGKLLRGFGRVVGAFARTDHGHRVAVAFRELTADIEHNGRIVYFAQGGRVFCILGGDDVRSEVRRFFEFRGGVGKFLPAGNIFGQGAGDAVDGGQLIGAGEEDFLGGAEGIKQAAQAHRSHLRDHVQRDAGLEVIHGRPC